MGEGDRTLPEPKPNLPNQAADGGLTNACTEDMLGTSLKPGWSPPSLEELQKLLPQYEISAFIAHGGMGAVYKGMQTSLRRTVAIKVLPPEIKERDPQFAARFKHEAQSMAQLSHPNIVAVHDAGETPGGLLYFIMEFVEGTDVGQFIASQGRIDPQRAIQITTDVCDALAFAHGEGIVHRDIKPSNIMLDKRGRVKVADFGLAKTVSEGATMLTETNVAMGTPDFMAPETFHPGIKIDARADIYAVGVMLCQMLTGSLPRGRFESPSDLVPQMDVRFDAIVDKAMCTDRELRYSSAQEMRLDLDGLPKMPGGLNKEAQPATTLSSRHATMPQGRKVKKSAASQFFGGIVAATIIGTGAFLVSKKPAATAPRDSSIPDKQSSSKADGAPIPTAHPVSYPAGVWTKVEALPRTDLTVDGWLQTRPGMIYGRIEVPDFKGCNQAIRARFRSQAPKGALPMPPIQLLVRSSSTGNFNTFVVRTLEGFGIRHDKTPTPRGIMPPIALSDLPVQRPPSEEFTLQLAVLDKTLFASCKGVLIQGQMEEDSLQTEGVPGLFVSNIDLFRDIEVINLDGLPRNEALRILGIMPVPTQQDIK